MGKTPTLEEVKEYFKDAKKVKCISNPYKGKKLTIISNTIEYDNETKAYYCDCKEIGTDCLLWDTKGYAKILSYKKPKEEKKELVVGRWYKRRPMSQENDMLFCFTGSYGNLGNNYGFNCSGKWSNELSVHHDSICREANPKEVEEALTKEAVKIGYHTDKPIHINYKNGSGFMKNPSKNVFWFRDGILYLWDIKIFEYGVWSEIIPTLTKQQAEEKLKELGVNVKIV